MIFSVEPGLYDPENGFGVNFSDGFAVQARRQAVAPDVAAAVERGVVPGEAVGDQGFRGSRFNLRTSAGKRGSSRTGSKSGSTLR